MRASAYTPEVNVDPSRPEKLESSELEPVDEVGRGGAGWEKPSRLECVVLAIATVLIVGAVCLQPILRAVWPELAVECALRQGSEVDPWEKPWVGWLKEGFAMSCYSCGPNGLDEVGEGDDVWGVLGDLAFAVDPDHAGWGLLGWLLAPLHLLTLGFVLLWLVAVDRLWTATRVRSAWEFLWAGALAALPVAVVWIVVAAWSQPGTGSLPFPNALMVPAEVGLAGTLSLIFYLVALGRRLSRPAPA